jgi:hypothetical protein
MDQPTPSVAVNIPAEQASALRRQLSEMRHNINNHLALIVGATELIRRKPDIAARMLDTQAEQTKRIEAEIKKFSALFDNSFEPAPAAAPAPAPAQS